MSFRDTLINFLLRSIRIEARTLERAINDCDVDKDGYLDALELWGMINKVRK